MASLTTSPNTNAVENRFFLGWIFLLGASLSLSIAVANIFMVIAILYLFIKHPTLIKKQFNSPIIKALVVIALLLQAIEIMHDGWFIAKASKVFLTFTITYMLGSFLQQRHIPWLLWLLSGLILGLAIGTPLNQYLNPEYPLWATYSMTYANQAAGFALTVGLLSIASKKWWVIVPTLILVIYYIYMAGERSAILALASSMIVLLIVLRKYKLLMTLGIITTAIAITYSHGSIKNEYDQNVRFDIWQYGYQIALKDNFLGRGEYQDLKQEDLDLYKSFATGNGKAYLKDVLPHHPEPSYKISFHNQVVQFLVEYGMIGSLIFLCFLVIPIISAWKTDVLSHEQITFAIIWSAFATHCIFETAFDAHTAIILGLLAGLMGSLNAPENEVLSS